MRKFGHHINGVLSRMIAVMLISVSISFSVNAQQLPTRILFIFDASSSMEQEWTGRSKFEIAKEVLSRSIDSLELVYPKAQFALRVYGHQSHQSLQDCEDSRLEVAFAPNNAQKIRNTLNQIKPQGYTPIEYSLRKAIVNDFPDHQNYRNIIVLITDGLEKCGGDPCSVGNLMKERNISCEPYVVGLGLGDEGYEYFNCVGVFEDVSNAEQLKNVLDVIVTQTLNATTVQVNLISASGLPDETNVNFTIRDMQTGTAVVEYVHTHLSKGIPDTIFLSPKRKYEIEVYTLPTVVKKNLEIFPGRHNIIGVDVPQGYLTLLVKSMYGQVDMPAVIRKSGSDEIIHVQNMLTSEKYITGYYDIEILSTPRIYFDSVEVKPYEETKITMDKWGFLTLFPGNPGIASVYLIENDEWKKVQEIREFNSQQSIAIQPGTYKVVYRSNETRKADETLIREITIIPGKESILRF